MTVYRHQGKWAYDFWKNGRRIRQAGFSTKLEAQIEEVEARKNLKKMNSDFIGLCESRLKEIQLRRTPKYFEENLKLIKTLIRLWGTKKEVTREDVEEYLDGKAKQSTTSVGNKELRFIKALFNHGIQREWFTYNPAGRVKYFPVEKKKKYIPSVEDVIKVLSVISSEQRDYLLVVINTVARIGEINNLRWDDVYDDYLILKTRKAKNSNVKERKIPFNDSLREILARLPRQGEHVFINPKTGRPFDYRKQFLLNACARAKVKPFGFHSLRHLGASRLNQEGIPLTDIQKILGHERASTTDIYLQSISKSLKDAMSKLDLTHKSHP